MAQVSQRRIEPENSHEATFDGSMDFEPPDGHPPFDRHVAELVHEHFDFIWRSLRRLGVPVPETDDAAQKVFWIAARKMQSQRVERARAFLFAIALRVAGDERRSLRRKREFAVPSVVDDAHDFAPAPDELLEQ